MANYIVTDKIRVNIVHGTSVPPRVKCEQYDGDYTRQIEATVYNGDVLYTIPSEVRRIVISGLKPDNTGFSYDCTWSGTKVLFSLMRQMTVVAGSVPCNISFFDGSNNQLSSAVFVLDVGAAALPSDVVVSSNDFQTFVDYVQAANLYWQYSKSYAVGNTGIRSGENTDNSQYYAHLARMYNGAPRKAATASAMTDVTKIYVYVGSESGYNNGHWYFYNDSAWEDGGVYNAQGQQTDTELITPGIAADAEAVGNILGHETLETTAQTLSGGINEIIANIKNTFVTPQMFGATADGTNDDTQAIQTAIDSGKIVIIPNGTYMLSAPISVKHDVRVICGENAQFKMLANLTRLLEVGVTIDGDTNPIFPGLVKCVWDGGIFWGANDDYTATDVIRTEKTYVSEFKNITVVNVVTNGIHIAGSIGAWALFENCAVRGINGNGTRGFLIERSDQHIVNCTVCDCIHGFETNANNILFDRCTAWMSTNTQWNETMCFYLGGAYNIISNCVIDTMYFGIRFKSNFKYGLASNISWINNSNVVADVTGMTLLSTDSPSDGYKVKFKVNGITVDAFGQTVRFKRDVSNAINTQITNIIIKDSTVANVADFYTAAVYSEDKTYTQGTGTLYVEPVNGGLHIRWHADLTNVQPNDVIIPTSGWHFPELATKCLPVDCLNANNGEPITNGVVWVSANGTLQFELRGSTTYNLSVDLDFISKQISL